jgi:hypothetical protein
MKTRWIGAALLALSPLATFGTTFRIDHADATGWTRILGAIGIGASKSQNAEILIAGPESAVDLAAASERQLVVIEGLGRAAEGLGISQKPNHISIRQISDVRAPGMQIFWQPALDVPEAVLPPGFEVFAKEKWTGAPVLAGKKTAAGAILWLATNPGPGGYERYPYLLQALQDVGLKIDSSATNLWAFFDSAYRIRADPDYLARRWRKAGISALHVAAWHNLNGDRAQDTYVESLIAACHRNAILVYAWLELPHVSDQFWDDHPELREKTAAGQDAQLDWRKLMNLQNPECREQAAREIHALLQRFDWDGVNLAELYFESLEGAANPARFTPMNDDVRREFAASNGFDPKALFEPHSASALETHPELLRAFLGYRMELAARMQREWLGIIGEDRKAKPYLNLVVTQIDDRFDPRMHDSLGANVALSLPVVRERDGTMLVEDPATLWNLGPERYRRLASEYQKLTSTRDRLAIDLNVVERYQDVYPTKKQTGVELFELVHQASFAFGRLALYIENSLERQDLELLPAAASTATVQRTAPGEVAVDTPSAVRVHLTGPVQLDGRLWPLQTSDSVLVPAGKHALKEVTDKPSITLEDFNGEVRSAMISGSEAQISYTSSGRAIAVPCRSLSLIEVDGASYWKAGDGTAPEYLLLPAGQHVVTLRH